MNQFEELMRQRMLFAPNSVRPLVDSSMFAGPTYAPDSAGPGRNAAYFDPARADPNLQTENVTLYDPLTKAPAMPSAKRPSVPDARFSRTAPPTQLPVDRFRKGKVGEFENVETPVTLGGQAFAQPDENAPAMHYEPTAGDIWRGIGVGLLKGTGSVAGTPRAIIDLLQKARGPGNEFASQSTLDRYLPTETAAQAWLAKHANPDLLKPDPMAKGEPAYGPQPVPMPQPRRAPRQPEFYEPSSEYGKYAQAAAEWAPWMMGGIVGGGVRGGLAGLLAAAGRAGASAAGGPIKYGTGW